MAPGMHGTGSSARGRPLPVPDWDGVASSVTDRSARTGAAPCAVRSRLPTRAESTHRAWGGPTEARPSGQERPPRSSLGGSSSVSVGGCMRARRRRPRLKPLRFGARGRPGRWRPRPSRDSAGGRTCIPGIRRPVHSANRRVRRRRICLWSRTPPSGAPRWPRRSAGLDRRPRPRSGPPRSAADPSSGWALELPATLIVRPRSRGHPAPSWDG